MKRLTVAAVILLGAIGAQPKAVADETTWVVQIPISNTIIPSEFTSRSEAYIIETGFLNGCYQWLFTQTTDLPQNVIEIRNYATTHSGMCPRDMISYERHVALGRLPTGIYSLRFFDDDRNYLEEPLEIKVSP